MTRSSDAQTLDRIIGISLTAVGLLLIPLSPVSAAEVALDTSDLSPAKESQLRELSGGEIFTTSAWKKGSALSGAGGRLEVDDIEITAKDASSFTLFASDDEGAGYELDVEIREDGALSVYDLDRGTLEVWERLDLPAKSDSHAPADGEAKDSGSARVQAREPEEGTERFDSERSNSGMTSDALLRSAVRRARATLANGQRGWLGVENREIRMNVPSNPYSQWQINADPSDPTLVTLEQNGICVTRDEDIQRRTHPGLRVTPLACVGSPEQTFHKRRHPASEEFELSSPWSGYCLEAESTGQVVMNPCFSRLGIRIPDTEQSWRHARDGAWKLSFRNFSFIEGVHRQDDAIIYRVTAEIDISEPSTIRTRSSFDGFFGVEEHLVNGNEFSPIPGNHTFHDIRFGASPGTTKAIVVASVAYEEELGGLFSSPPPTLLYRSNFYLERAVSDALRRSLDGLTDWRDLRSHLADPAFTAWLQQDIVESLRRMAQGGETKDSIRPDADYIYIGADAKLFFSFDGVPGTDLPLEPVSQGLLRLDDGPTRAEYWVHYSFGYAER